jgi:hypothetical protein
MAACPDRDRKVVEWRESVTKFADAVKRLAESTRERDGFLDQFHITDLARQQCEAARKILKHHRAEHNC